MVHKDAECHQTLERKNELMQAAQRLQGASRWEKVTGHFGRL